MITARLLCGVMQVNPQTCDIHKIRSDDTVDILGGVHRMRRIVVLILLSAAAIVGVAGCSSRSNTAEENPASSSSESPLTTIETSSESSDSISAETIVACRSLPDDEDLAEFWREIANNGSASAVATMRAIGAVQRLELYTSDPEVDPDVQAAMKTATDAVSYGKMIPMDVDKFRDVITPVVEACEAEDVDMYVD